MQTIGERLEEARKRKGISIREAAETTKIRGDYLQKFEANSFDIDLPPLYLRGFIRTYAKFLDLDAERLIGDVDAALARDGKPQRREHREALGRVDFGGEPRAAEGGEPAAGNGRSARDQAMLIKLGILGGGALLLVVVIILLINVIFFRGTAKPAPQANAPVSTQPAAPAENVLTLIAKGPVRVKVVRVSNNQVLLDGLSALATGETKMVRYTDKLKVTVDDPSKLAMELNGRRQELPIQQYGFFFIEP
jgi:transcriptional regulator with XRE-family HTH domain